MSNFVLDTVGSRVLRTRREGLSLLVLPNADATDWLALDQRVVTISLHPSRIQLKSRIFVLRGARDILGNVGRPELALEWPTEREVPSSLSVAT